jgi:hypothetical protein
MNDFYLSERTMQQAVAHEHRQAELSRLQKETEAGHSSWLVRQRYRVISGVACFLITLGQQLLQSVSAKASAEAQANHRA